MLFLFPRYIIDIVGVSYNIYVKKTFKVLGFLFSGKKYVKNVGGRSDVPPVNFVSAFAVRYYKASVFSQNRAEFFSKSPFVREMGICPVYKGSVKIGLGEV